MSAIYEDEVGRDLGRVYDLDGGTVKVTSEDLLALSDHPESFEPVVIAGASSWVPGVAMNSAAADSDPVVVALRGVFRLPIIPTGGIAAGDGIYWDVDSDKLVKAANITAGESGIFYGVAMSDVSAGASAVNVPIMLAGGPQVGESAITADA